MHYTSPENIHGVIGPLFQDALRGEPDGILTKQNPSARTGALRAYRDKLGSLSFLDPFLDPTCDSGNFFTRHPADGRHSDRERQWLPCLQHFPGSRYA